MKLSPFQPADWLPTTYEQIVYFRANGVPKMALKNIVEKSGEYKTQPDFDL